ncbi:MAG: insulinase family protein [Rhizobacter sp.]|nr:insulinase family protein [Rhizobacter sp.]
MSALAAERDATVVHLGNGVRVLAIALPHLESANVSVFVRTGSSHEPRRLNGISHFVEHMAFKGTRTRSCQQINWDAERLGADVNAHTDKDHTAYHMRGLAEDAPRFVVMLGDIVLASSFPDVELERERQVILHELTEDEEDVLATADKLFDKLSFGSHPVAQPVIGSRLTIQHIGRADLLEYVERQYTGANIVVGVAGRFDLDAIVAAAEAAFAMVPGGDENRVAAPPYSGGIASRVQPGYSQTHVVMGYPIPSLREDHHPAMVAAALFGEGMSSPLMDEIRERRGLVYYASCAADVNEVCGQFVVEASTSPAQLDEFLFEVRRLLAKQAHAIAADDLERARRQIAVRTLRTQERPVRRLEDAALDLFAHGRIRSRAETLARVEAIGAAAVRDVFATMLATPVALAIAGRIKKGGVDRARELFA